MKKNFYFLSLLALLLLASPIVLSSQANMGNVVNVQKMKMKWPENGSASARDSLLTIYNDQVIKKNEFILSHREYRHYFTGDNKDYLVIEEYADLASMQKAFTRTTELEDAAWPDEKQADAFFEALDAYFEDWHGDALYTTNSKLSKN